MSKVILLAPTPPPIGGIAQWTVRMMNAKLEHGWQVEVVDEKILGVREVFGDKTKHDFKAEVIRCLTIWKNLRSALNDKEAKVVHSCIAANTMPVLREYICAVITKHHKRKFIIHFRCTVPNRVNGRLNKIVLKLLCGKSDCVMVLNKQSEAYIKKITNTPICLIPNFVSAEELNTGHIINKEIKRVVYVGGVIEAKGCLDIVEVAKEYPQIEFRLVGKSESKVRDAAFKVPNMVLVGALGQKEVQKELKLADVFIFLSYFSGEGFSNALAEAMANGLPCLVTDWAANKDMIENKGGEVVPIKDVEAVIKALKKMMSETVREKQSKFNLYKVKTKYNDKIVLNQYVECYERSLKRKKDEYNI